MTAKRKRPPAGIDHVVVVAAAYEDAEARVAALTTALRDLAAIADRRRLKSPLTIRVIELDGTCSWTIVMDSEGGGRSLIQPEGAKALPFFLVAEAADGKTIKVRVESDSQSIV